MLTRRARYTPRRGDISRLDFDPSAGHEQQGTRPALVLSLEAFYRFGMALACPITRVVTFSRGQAWTVSMTGGRAGNRRRSVVQPSRHSRLERAACAVHRSRAA